MGCDIHLVLERRVTVKRRKKWVGIDCFRTYSHDVYTMRAHKGLASWFFHTAESRNYTRFAALAGVRGEGPAPKGVPDDASDLTLHEVDMWGGDGHSHSWLPLREAKQIFQATEREPNEVFLDEDDPRGKYPYDYWFGLGGLDDDESKADEYRLVFWFDN